MNIFGTQQGRVPVDATNKSVPKCRQYPPREAALCHRRTTNSAIKKFEFNLPEDQQGFPDLLTDLSLNEVRQFVCITHTLHAFTEKYPEFYRLADSEDVLYKVGSNHSY